MEAREAKAMASWRAGAGQSWLEPLSCRPAGSSSGMISLEMDRQLTTILGTSSTSGGVVWSGLVTTTQVNTEISPQPSFSPKLMYDPDPHLADLYWSKHMGDSYCCKTI